MAGILRCGSVLGTRLTNKQSMTYANNSNETISTSQSLREDVQRSLTSQGKLFSNNSNFVNKAKSYVEKKTVSMFSMLDGKYNSGFCSVNNTTLKVYKDKSDTIVAYSSNGKLGNDMKLANSLNSVSYLNLISNSFDSHVVVYEKSRAITQHYKEAKNGEYLYYYSAPVGTVNKHVADAKNSTELVKYLIRHANDLAAPQNSDNLKESTLESTYNALFANLKK